LNHAQNIFADQQYNKPFFITYINTASFSLYLLGPLFKRWGRKTMDAIPLRSSRSNRSTSSYGSCGSSESLDTLASSESTLEQGSQTTLSPKETPLSHREIAQLSFTFCILWFAANWATNASLAYTSVASSTILASMSGFFTLAIGAALKTESFSALKLIAVCASVIGVALVSESDRGDEPRPMSPTAPRAPLFGDFLALLSALFYGCYTVLLKVKIQNENRINMSLFFGFVGLFNLLLLWPMFGLLHWTGVEPFELPRDPRIIGMIVGNALIGTFV
jgi:solute carrier family 35 protein F5